MRQSEIHTSVSSQRDIDKGNISPIHLPFFHGSRPNPSLTLSKTGLSRTQTHFSIGNHGVKRIGGVAVERRAVAASSKSPFTFKLARSARATMLKCSPTDSGAAGASAMVF